MSQEPKYTHITDEEMAAYLDGRLTKAQRLALEERMSQEDLYTDALEGLHEMGSEEARQMTRHINQTFAATLEKKRRKNRRLRRNEQPTFWQVVLLVLLLLFVAAVVLWMIK